MSLGVANGKPTGVYGDFRSWGSSCRPCFWARYLENEAHAALFPLHGNHTAIIAGESGLDLAAKIE